MILIVRWQGQRTYGSPDPRLICFRVFRPYARGRITRLNSLFFAQSLLMSVDFIF
ncbi:MAG: hypothetical protein KAU38_13865 [Desulfobacterales bacterium]|nr:hypothetical protein [Desulfobacterales bacterium]